MVTEHSFDKNTGDVTKRSGCGRVIGWDGNRPVLRATGNSSLQFSFFFPFSLF